MLSLLQCFNFKNMPQRKLFCNIIKLRDDGHNMDIRDSLWIDFEAKLSETVNAQGLHGCVMLILHEDMLQRTEPTFSSKSIKCNIVRYFIYSKFRRSRARSNLMPPTFHRVLLVELVCSLYRSLTWHLFSLFDGLKSANVFYEWGRQASLASSESF